MGVSSGAALGAVLAMSFFGGMFSTAGIQLGSVVCGLGATAFVCAAGKGGKIMSCLLGGIAVNALCGALVGFFLYAAREAGVKSYIFWMLGSLDGADWKSIGVSAAMSVPMWIAVVLSARGLNMLLLGAEQAYHSGVKVGALWAVCVAACTVMTAAAVSVCGIVGFVGLVVPHISRLLVGRNTTKSLPLTIFIGAIFMLLCDIISRSFTFSEIPLSAVSGFIGTPIFICILVFKKGDKNDATRN